MCLFKGKNKCKTAEKDITTYKCIYTDNKSLYWFFPYRFNITYQKVWNQDFVKYADSSNELGWNAFHSCKDLKICKEFFGQEKQDVKLVKCLIPKGSLYYEGTYDEIASNQIIILEDVTEHNDSLSVSN